MDNFQLTLLLSVITIHNIQEGLHRPVHVPWRDKCPGLHEACFDGKFLVSFFLRDLQSHVSTFDDEWQLQLIALRPLTGPRKLAFVGSIQSRFSLPPAQVIKSLPLLPVLLQVLFLLQLNGALLLYHLLPLFFVVPPLYHFLGSLLLHKDVWLTAAHGFMAWKSEITLTSDSTSRRSSPAEGRSFQPTTSTAALGLASLTGRPFSSNKKRTLPQVFPATSTVPCFKVPCWTIAVVTGLRKDQTQK